MGKKKGAAAASSGPASAPSSPTPQPPAPALGGRAANKKDPSTLSNYEEIRSQHLKLQLDVDFDRQVLAGWAEHTMRAQVEGVARAVFDTSAGLAVAKVEVDGQCVFLGAVGRLGGWRLVVGGLAYRWPLRGACQYIYGWGET